MATCARGAWTMDVWYYLFCSMGLRRHLVLTCSMHWWRMGKVMPGKGDVAGAVAGALGKRRNVTRSRVATRPFKHTHPRFHHLKP